MEVKVGQKVWSIITGMYFIAPGRKQEVIQKIEGDAVYSAPANGGDVRRFVAEENHFSYNKGDTLLFVKKQDMVDWMEEQIRGRYERMCRLSKGKKLRKMDLEVLNAMKERWRK